MYDIVVPGDSLLMGYDANTRTTYLSVPQLDETIKQHELTNYAHEQIATKTGIPIRYYERMREDGKLELLSQNVNTWLPDREKRLVRVQDDKVRAVLSDRYRIIDNYDVVFETLEQLKKIQEKTGLQIDVKECSLTDRHLYMKITSPGLSGKVLHYKGREEPVEGGIIISNSEVGCGAFRVEPFVNVLICQNVLIGEHKLAKVHLGKERGIGLIDWSDETLEYQDMELWSSVRDLIIATFNPEIFSKWLDEINEVAGKELEKPLEAVDNVIKRYGLPQKMKDDLVSQFMKESPTVWGLSMAVTRVAQRQENYETQVDMERIGAKIIEEALVAK
jgi:hypothetical protein